LTTIPPEAAAICFIKLREDINSLDFIMRLMKEKSVLINSGEHFDMPGYLRIGFGTEPEYLEPALELIGELLDTYR
jgi:aspartate/methionine/tyrosine aminotransferase